MKRHYKQAIRITLGNRYQYIDDVFDQMASRWAAKAERLTRASMRRAPQPE